MQLEHSFTVPVGIDDAWKVLLDIERIAPCMPGAALDSVTGDDFTGTVKVKLGPIGLTYKGKASFTEKDETTHRAVIDAQGRDSRGNGTAGAKVTATLTSKGAAETEVGVLTDLNITGKPAQFGRGVMVDVGNKLIGQFADCLAGKLAAGDIAPETEAGADAAGSTGASATDTLATDAPAAAAASAGTASTTTAPRTTPAQTSTVTDAGTNGHRPTPPLRPAPAPQEVEPIDLLGSAGGAVAKRLVPVVVGAAAVAAVVVVVLRRRR